MAATPKAPAKKPAAKTTRRATKAAPRDTQIERTVIELPPRPVVDIRILEGDAYAPLFFGTSIGLHVYLDPQAHLRNPIVIAHDATLDVYTGIQASLPEGRIWHLRSVYPRDLRVVTLDGTLTHLAVYNSGSPRTIEHGVTLAYASLVKVEPFDVREVTA